MSIKRDLWLLLKPYYIVNILMSIGFIVAKKTPILCTFLFPTANPVCEFDSLERIEKRKKAEEEKRLVPQVSSALFFQYNTQLGPPFHIIVDTNFINFSIKYKLDIIPSMMDCLYAKCIPYITDCVLAEVEKLGRKYKRETEILFFLTIVVMIRTRKAGSVTMINYLTSSFVYTKVANAILWFYQDIRMGLIFAVLFVLCGLLLPEPTYSGPDKVTYFRTAAGLEDEVNRDKRVTWLVAFYTAWNPNCVNMAPVFAQLSADYDLENLKFGKIDVGRYPDAATAYKVNDSSLSKQLPTIILFKEGKESLRVPSFDSQGKLKKFFFTEDNIKAAFDLNNLYKECRANPLKHRKKAAQKATESPKTENGNADSGHEKSE